MNSIRFSLFLFTRAAGLKEYSVTTVLLLYSTRRRTDEFSLSLYIYQEEAESTDEDGDEQPKQKKQKTDKKKKKKKQDANNSDSENSDVIDDLSGDEVDQSNIIAGGRASRSTRPVFTKQMYAAANLEDESEDEE